MSCIFPGDKWEKIKNQRSAVQIPIVTILTHESFLWTVMKHGYFVTNGKTINDPEFHIRYYYYYLFDAAQKRSSEMHALVKVYEVELKEVEQKFWDVTTS